ncbi:MAG: MFS transporter, partial [Actinobacteria bacterium]|nr:MFS transporter [Actinomycetota bacterium]
GVIVPHARHLFQRRTSVLIAGTVLSPLALVLVGVVPSFFAVVAVLAVWAIVFAATVPIRQAYLNELIPSEERATLLSSDNLFGSLGGVVFQPALGKVADAWSYSVSYVVAAGVQLLGLPFVLLARRERAQSDVIPEEPDHPSLAPPIP